MITRMKSASLVGAFLIVSIVAPLATAAPSAAAEFPDLFWTELRMKAMDSNKDGTVSRDEFITYMGAQFDRMDQDRNRMLTAKEFTDKKMMRSTFPSSAREHGPA